MPKPYTTTKPIQDLLKDVVAGNVRVVCVKHNNPEVFVVQLESMEQGDVLGIDITLPMEVFNKYSY